jgi:HEAT repeat protein
MSERNAVLTWVRKAPFDDMKLMAMEPNFSYDEWFRRGRELPHSVEILSQMLGEEQLDRPSGDGMRIAYALGWIGDRRKTVIAALIRSVGSKDTALRAESASALGRLRETSARPLLEKLLADPKEDTNVRGNACIALGRIADPRSEPLLHSISKSSDAFLSACGKEALRLYKENVSVNQP